MDTYLVETLNRWFTANAFRADLCRAFAIVPLLLIGVVVVLAWSTPRSNSPVGRSELLLGLVAAVGALLLNLALGHLYYRARPFLVLDVRPLLPEAVDSSLFSDHLAVAGAAVAALVVARRTFGWLAAGLGLLLAIGRVGAGVQYPTDCLVGLGAGAACFFLILPLRGPVSRAIAAAYPGIGEPQTKPEHAFTHRHRRGISITVAFLVFGSGYGIRAIQDHGWKSAALRAEGMLQANSAPAPPGEFQTIPIATIAAGKSGGAYAAVVGDVSQVSHELDGDYHIRLEGEGAFLVLEIMPEFPLSPPHIGQQITAWGVIRHDGLHNWWELHPVVGWQPGNVAGPPGTGTGSSD
jgi:membrane-associated phospholipid phosphatase